MTRYRLLTSGAFALVFATTTVSGCKKDTPPEPAVSAEPAAEAAGAEAAKPAAPEGDKAVAAADPHAGATADGARITGPVAKINGVPIASEEFYAELDKITARGAKIPAERLARIEQNILKRLIEKELVRQAVEKAGVKVEEAEIDSAYDEYKKRFQTDEQFENYLKHGRVTVESIKARIAEKRALEKLIESKGNMAVTDEEAKDFYAKNERFYLDKAGVKASHILVKLPEKATPEQEKAALDKIKAIEAELKSGKTFEDVATRMSEGPSAPKGGDLGFFGAGQMVKPFEEKAFAMKVGEVSGPVRTRFGFHIIKVVEKREERKKTFEEVKDQIEQSLKNKKFFQERRALLEELEKEAKIEKFIADPPPAPAGAPEGSDHEDEAPAAAPEPAGGGE